jgi:hypothetical protein
MRSDGDVEQCFARGPPQNDGELLTQGETVIDEMPEDRARPDGWCGQYAQIDAEPVITRVRDAGEIVWVVSRLAERTVMPGVLETVERQLVEEWRCKKDTGDPVVHVAAVTRVLMSALVQEVTQRPLAVADDEDRSDTCPDPNPVGNPDGKAYDCPVRGDARE